MKIITTHNLHESTEQEVFDFICTKVIEQGRPSRKIIDGEQAECAYRGADNTKCAFGVIVADEDYWLLKRDDHEVAGLSSFSYPLQQKLGWELNSVGEPVHFELLLDLQRAHDVASSHPNFATSFKNLAHDVAHRRGLSATVLGVE